MDIGTVRHVIFALHVHPVFTTKRRGKVVTMQHKVPPVICEGLCEDFDVPKSRGVLWKPSCFATSVGGAMLAVLKQDIENQSRSWG